MARFTMAALAVTLMVSTAPVLAQPPAGPAQSQGVRQTPRVTGRSLLAVCTENRAACLTYVMGAIDGVVMAATLVAGRNPLCLPADATNLQLTDAVIRYLRAHPEDADVSGAAVVVAGLVGAYPCPRQ
ncbi:MAG TPA: Rap1a/Tai family immunity protein [Allosphingosinicella sp.]|nr:Rap1a/Tai family immunity protein [Allosphingosinicella sp.]